MGMYDSVNVDFKCSVCGYTNSSFELQIKDGDCNLETWGTGSKTTLPPGQRVESFYCDGPCHLREATDKEQIEFTVQNSWPSTVTHGDKVYVYLEDSWCHWARFTVSRKRILENVELMNPCDKCHGHGYTNYVEVARHRFPGPVPDRIECPSCDGLGYLEEVIEGIR